MSAWPAKRREGLRYRVEKLPRVGQPLLLCHLLKPNLHPGLHRIPIDEHAELYPEQLKRAIRDIALVFDGISRCYVRRLLGLAFLSPQLVEAILQRDQPVALTATRLTALDLLLGWTEQHRLLAG